MNFRLALSALALTGIALTGCSSDPASDSDNAVPGLVAVTPEPVAEPINDDAFFVDFIRDEDPSMFYGVSDADVVELAHLICGAFDAGNSFEDVAMIGLESGYTGEQTGGFIGASVVTYCPEHEDQYS